MTPEIAAELKAIIEKNLPAQVGAVLQQHLKDAEALKAANLRLELALKEQKDISKILEKALEELRALKVTKEAQDKKALELEARERNMHLEIAHVKMAFIDQKCAAIQSLVDTVFRNPRLTYSESGQVPVRSGGNDGSYVGSHNFSKTTTVEEGK